MPTHHSPSATRIAQLFRLQSTGALRALGIVWGWTIPLHDPQLRLRSLTNPHGDDWIAVDRSDGSIELTPHLTTPALIRYQDELLRDLQAQLPRIIDAWTETLVAVGQLRLIPVPKGCWVTIHPGRDNWERNLWVPVDWPRLIGTPNPQVANAHYDGDLAVAVLGTEDKQVTINLAQLLWPDVKQYGAVARTASTRVAAA
jgi:hypothetical protein